MSVSNGQQIRLHGECLIDHSCLVVVPHLMIKIKSWTSLLYKKYNKYIKRVPSYFLRLPLKILGNHAKNIYFTFNIMFLRWND